MKNKKPSRPPEHKCSNKKHLLLSSQSGAILLWLVFVLIFVAGLAGGLLTFSFTSPSTELIAHFQEKAYYLAESGGRYASALVKEDIQNAAQTNITTINNQTYALTGDGDFTLNIDTTDPLIFLIHSTGIANAGSYFESQAQLTFQINIDALFQYGIFGDGTITMKNGASVDAYDSSQGTYGSTQDSNAGDVATSESSANINARAVIGGDTLYDVDKTLLPITLPACTSPCTNLRHMSLSGTRTLTGGSGDFSADSVELKNHSVLTISGDVTLIVDGDFRAKNGASILLAANATLTLYVSGDINFDNGSSINDGGFPENLIIYGTGIRTEINIKNSSGIYAVIYAPGADITIHNSAELYGAIIGNNVELKNNAEIHYDQALINSSTLNTVSGPIQYFTK